VSRPARRRSEPAGPAPSSGPRLKATAAEGSDDVIDFGKRLTLESTACPIASGHVLRSAPCLLCNEVIGAQSARIVFLVDLTYPASDTGQVTSAVYLIHDTHPPQPTGLLHKLAHRRSCAWCSGEWHR
jgi:hypothetical protein